MLCDVGCTRKSHMRERDLFCDDLISVCLEAGYSCFPKCKVAMKCKPGWNAEVRDLRDDSLFWH